MYTLDNSNNNVLWWSFSVRVTFWQRECLSSLVQLEDEEIL